MEEQSGVQKQTPWPEIARLASSRMDPTEISGGWSLQWDWGSGHSECRSVTSPPAVQGARGLSAQWVS